jgi:hypothetical protein
VGALLAAGVYLATRPAQANIQSTKPMGQPLSLDVCAAILKGMSVDLGTNAWNAAMAKSSAGVDAMRTAYANYLISHGMPSAGQCLLANPSLWSFGIPGMPTGTNAGAAPDTGSGSFVPGGVNVVGGSVPAFNFGPAYVGPTVKPTGTSMAPLIPTVTTTPDMKMVQQIVDAWNTIQPDQFPAAGQPPSRTLYATLWDATSGVDDLMRSSVPDSGDAVYDRANRLLRMYQDQKNYYTNANAICVLPTIANFFILRHGVDDGLPLVTAQAIAQKYPPCGWYGSTS